MSPLHVPLKELRGQKPHLMRFFRALHQDFAISFRSAKRFYNFETTAYNTDVHSLCVPNLLGGGSYSKGKRQSVKFSFRPLTAVLAMTRFDNS